MAPGTPFPIPPSCLQSFFIFILQLGSGVGLWILACIIFTLEAGLSRNGGFRLFVTNFSNKQIQQKLSDSS